MKFIIVLIPLLITLISKPFSFMKEEEEKEKKIMTEEKLDYLLRIQAQHEKTQKLFEKYKDSLGEWFEPAELSEMQAALEEAGSYVKEYEEYLNIASPQDVNKEQFGYTVSGILNKYIIAIYDILDKNDEGIGRNVIIDAGNIKSISALFFFRDKYPVVEQVVSIFEETIQAHSGKSLYTVAEALEKAFKPYTPERIVEEFFSRKYKGEKVSEMTLKRWLPKPEGIAEAFLSLAHTSDPNHPEQIARLKREAVKKELQKKELIISSWLNGELSSLKSWDYKNIQYIACDKLRRILHSRIKVSLSKAILSGIHEFAHPLDKVKSIIRLNLEKMRDKDPTPNYLLKEWWQIEAYRKNTIASSIQACSVPLSRNQKK